VLGSDSFRVPVVAASNVGSAPADGASVAAAMGGDSFRVPVVVGAGSTQGTLSGISQNGLAGSAANDSFAFHASLGDDTTHHADTPPPNANLSGNQPSAQSFGPPVPDSHTELWFDPSHHDTNDVGAMANQFHQMASTVALLH